jgi:hypothetical protein
LRGNAPAALIKIAGQQSKADKKGSRNLGNQRVVLEYVQSCAGGNLGMAECGPIWQLGVIAALLLIAIVALALLQFRARPQAVKASRSFAA